MYYFYYTDSLNHRHKIAYKLNEYHHLMELLWDQGYEDWGDCKARAWCGTCHVLTSEFSIIFERIEEAEKVCLKALANKTKNSRLACQILIGPALHSMEFSYLGEA